MTADLVQLDAARARQLTDRIKTALGATWELAAEAYQSRAWAALGYASWDDYTTQEFGTTRLRLPKEDRAEAVASLRESGLSLRAISAVLGDSPATIMRVERASAVAAETPAEGVEEDQGGWADGDGTDPAEPIAGDRQFYADRDRGRQQTADAMDASVEPAKVTGTDGKQYAAQGQSKPRQRAITDQANDLGFEMRKNADRLAALVGDKRYAQNEEQVSLLLRGHLLYVAETVAAVLGQMP